MKRAIASAIIQQVQPLSASIVQGGVERQKAIDEVHTQIITLRDEGRAFNTNANPRHHDCRTDKVIICRFGHKSKDGVDEMAEKVIDEKIEIQ